MNNEGCAEQAFGLIDDLHKQSDVAPVGDRVAAFVRQFGFDHILCLRMPLPRERLKPYTLFDTWPKDFWHHYDAQRFYAHDPVANHTFASTRPYLWSDVAIDHDAMPRARYVMNEAADAGLRQGLCVPVHDVNGFQAAVTMAGDRIDLSPRSKTTIQVLALIAFGIMDRHAKTPADIVDLSPREREILKQLGAGRTVAQAAARMGIADSSAATLLLRARHKLGTTNTVHTVVEALRLRQITL